MRFPHIFAEARESEAKRTVAAAIGAGKRAASVLASEASRPDGVGLASSLTRTLGDHDRIVRGAIESALGPVKPATAGSLTRAFKYDGADASEAEDGQAKPAAPAMRYADRRDVTGALVKLQMRVKAPGRSVPSDRPVALAPDAMASRMEQARGLACRDLHDAVHSFRSARNGAQKDAAKSKIRAILDTYEGDATIRAAAIDAGWKL